MEGGGRGRREREGEGQYVYFYGRSSIMINSNYYAGVSGGGRKEGREEGRGRGGYVWREERERE